MFITAISFLITALIYAAVGFGGGSTYTALLLIFSTPYLLVPILSLFCNIIVVTGGTWRFHRNKLIPWKKAWPLFATSVPMAWLGGTVLIDESTLIILLAVTLIIAGMTMLIKLTSANESISLQPISILWLPVVGAMLGFTAGMVGIGGGIFLAPILHFLRWGTSKVIAGVCSSFILINSLAGLAGQSVKFGDVIKHSEVLEYWPLFLAVLIGGQVGGFIGIKKLSAQHVKLLTAILVLFIGVRLLTNNWIR